MYDLSLSINLIVAKELVGYTPVIQKGVSYQKFGTIGARHFHWDDRKKIASVTWYFEKTWLTVTFGFHGEFVNSGPGWFGRASYGSNNVVCLAVLAGLPHEYNLEHSFEK